jgi:hypothetical protein
LVSIIPKAKQREKISSSEKNDFGHFKMSKNGKK